ncbi:MAG: RecQ family ATP-dependent DNA helicase [Acidobacteria bacterium]|nr:RecQ family ATP-dependent DNA helicase [Acidobacteriota bacterium]
MNDLNQTLREQFGFTNFRAGQREVIENILARRHTLAVLPTGSGKSLCYQLPAQQLPGLTLVVSPLIALMHDQVASLTRRGITNATFLSSALTPSEIGQRYHEIEQGKYKLVYIAPERCDAPRFQQLIQQRELSLVVIDEAHCISQWGHDFRPHYRTLFTRLPALRQATLLALTATATTEVQNDIAAALDLPALERIIADFNRPNLRFECFHLDRREDKDARLIELLKANTGAAIVYANTRREAQTVQQTLLSRDINALLYHAGLVTAERTAAQEKFQRDECPIIVATVAFGLGIDKPNVRRVIHYNLPGSLENYYQEAGRAGRDGASATCTLLYVQSDTRTQRFLLDQAFPAAPALYRVYDLLRAAAPLAVSASDLATAGQLPEITVSAALHLFYEQHWLTLTQEGKYAAVQTDAALQLETTALSQRRYRANERLRQMIAYALEPSCRRARILEYFGQRFTPPCGNCDVCDHAPAPTIATVTIAATEKSDRIARAILQAAADFNGRLGRTLIAEALAGSHSKRVTQPKLDQSRHHGALRLHGRERIRDWIDELIARALLRTTAEEFPLLCLTEAGRAALTEATPLPLSHCEEVQAAPPVVTEPIETPPPADSLLERLQLWRREKAVALNVPPYVVLHNSMLSAITEQRPRTESELSKIKGIGTQRLAQFGADLLRLVVASAPPPVVVTHDLRLQIEIWRQGGAPPDAQTLLAKLNEFDHTDLIVAVNVLKDLHAHEAAPRLHALLRETSNGQLLGTLCEALGQLGETAAVADVIKLLDDERPGVRRAAARALGRLRVRAALERLATMAQQDAAESVKLSARAAAWLIEETTG